MHAPTPVTNPDVATLAESAASDRVLLNRFAQTHDEAAFAELVRRHAPLVMGACRRVLDRSHDAEDAFQAAFMALARSSDRVRVANTLAPWLYGTAHRIAVRAAQQRSRRQEARMPDDVVDRHDPLAHMEAAHRLRVLEEEINRLPLRLREPIVLHYLLGKSNREIAAELNLSVRTVEGRQRRGKAALRRQLVLRRVSLPLAAAALTTVQQAASPVASAALIEQTVSASLSFAAGESGVASPGSIASLAQSEVIAMSSSAPSALIAVAVVALVGGAVAIAEQQFSGDAASQPLALAASEINSFGEASDDTFADLAGDPFARSSDSLDDPLARQRADGASVPVADAASPAAEASKSRPQDAPRSLSLRSMTDSERQIEDAMYQRVGGLEYVETPLSQVMAALSEDSSVPIVFDKPALDEVAISPEIEVTVDLPEIQLRSALHLILRNASPDLDFLVQDEVLLITTINRSESQLETRVYFLQDLIEALNVGADEIAEIVMNSTGGGTWSGHGEGTVDTVGNHGLVVRQTQSVHREIAGLFDQLMKLAANQR